MTVFVLEWGRLAKAGLNVRIHQLEVVLAERCTADWGSISRLPEEARIAGVEAFHYDDKLRSQREQRLDRKSAYLEEAADRVASHTEPADDGRMKTVAGRNVSAESEVRATVRHVNSKKYISSDATYSMIRKWLLALPYSSLRMKVAQKEEQQDTKEDGCNHSPFDSFSRVGIPPVSIVAVPIVGTVPLSLSQVDHVCLAQADLVDFPHKES